MPSAGSIEADNQNPWEYTLHFSMLEVYNESIIDLLQIEGTSNNKKKKELDIRQTKDGNAVVGLMQIEVKSAEEVLALMTSGQSNRSVGCHNMNEHSSRSHSILTLTARGKHKHNGTTCFGKTSLSFVSLSITITIIDDRHTNTTISHCYCSCAISHFAPLITIIIYSRQIESY